MNKEFTEAQAVPEERGDEAIRGPVAAEFESVKEAKAIARQQLAWYRDMVAKKEGQKK